jgi:hypothetical protein
MYYQSVKETYLKEYTPLEFHESKVVTLPSNKWFGIEFFDNNSGRNYTAWEFFYKVPKTGGIIRYNYFAPREKQPIKFAVSNGMDQIMSLISSERDRFVESPLEYLQSSLFQNNFYPYETLYKWNRFSDPDKEYFYEVYEYLSFLYALSGDFKKNREFVMLHRSGASDLRVDNSENILYADDYITNVAEKAKILNLSEDHYYPRARNFITRQLKQLYKLGYRVIALEALSGKSSNDYYELDNIKRGVGYYTNEFNYANLLREAKQIGFKIVSYEAPSGKAVGTRRDFNSFSNIQKIINQELNENEKLLIISGHDHSSKQPAPGYGNTLGTYLFNEYGDQYVSIKTAQHLELDQDSYEYLQSKLNCYGNNSKESPTVFAQKDYDQNYDAVILYSPTEYDSNGIPTWYRDEDLMRYNVCHKNTSGERNYTQIVLLKDFMSYGTDSLPVFVYTSETTFDIYIDLVEDDYRVETYSGSGELISSYNL